MGQYMGKYTTILFDMDGTLLDTISDLTGSVNTTLHHYGYMERSEDEVKKFVGNGVMKLLERAFGRGVKNVDLAEAYDYFASHYQKNCRNRTCAFPGIPAMLEQLSQAGFTMGIVSNKNAQAVMELSENLLGGHIAVAVGASEDKPKKPAPDLVLEALRKLNRNREETIFIGDSEVDFETAQNAGMDCMLVTWGYNEKERLAGLKPAYLADSPADIVRNMN